MIFQSPEEHLILYLLFLWQKFSIFMFHFLIVLKHIYSSKLCKSYSWPQLQQLRVVFGLPERSVSEKVPKSSCSCERFSFHVRIRPNVQSLAMAGMTTIRDFNWKRPLNKFMSLCRYHGVSGKVATEHNQKVLCTLLSLHLHAKKNAQMPEYITMTFHDRSIAVPESEISRICYRTTWCSTGRLL